MVSHQWLLVVEMFGIRSVTACTEMTDMLPAGSMNTPEFQTMGFILEDVVLVHKKLLLHVMYCYPFIF